MEKTKTIRQISLSVRSAPLIPKVEKDAEKNKEVNTGYNTN